MADVTLAEVGGNAWLVDGEAFLDDLLANTLAPQVTIRIVACDQRADVLALWQRCTGVPPDGAQPWMIHPAIVARIKGQSRAPSIAFTPWSAMIDEAGHAAIADWRRRHPDAGLTLRQFSHRDAAAGLGDLQRLRAQLVSAALARDGVGADRIACETIGSDDPGDADRIELVIG